MSLETHKNIKAVFGSFFVKSKIVGDGFYGVIKT